MDLYNFVRISGLAGRDTDVASDRLVKLLRSETPDTIVGLYQEVSDNTEELYNQWIDRSEAWAAFNATAPAKAANIKNATNDPFPGAPPLLGESEDDGSEGFSFEEWLRGWCLYQVLTGNDEPNLDHPEPIDFFEGCWGTGHIYDFQDAYERLTGTFWPFKPREEDAEFLSYLEQREYGPYRVQLHGARAREVTKALNSSDVWRQWWLSGPLRTLEFEFVESHQMNTGTTPTSSRIRKVALTVKGIITPNIDRILETEEENIRSLAASDLESLLRKVSKKYEFAQEPPPIS